MTTYNSRVFYSRQIFLESFLKPKMSSDEIPADVAASMQNFQRALDDMTSNCQPLVTTTRSDIIRDVTAMESLKIDLTTALAVNSLYWGQFEVCDEKSCLLFLMRFVLYHYNILFSLLKLVYFV